MSWHGLEKFRKSWHHQLLSTLGHLAIGATAGLLPALASGPLWVCLLFGWLAGLFREVFQYASDDTPNLNLLDRARDIAEAVVGALLIGLALS